MRAMRSLSCHIVWILSLVFLSLVCSGPLYADWALNMPKGVSTTSGTIYDIHMLMLYVCTVIGIIVFGVMGYALIKHRRTKHPTPADFDDHLYLELTWLVIPALILIGCAVPATTSLLKLYDTSESDIDIKITAYQWKWHYEYLDQDISFFSNLTTPKEQISNQQEKGQNYLLEVDEHLVIPADKKVRFLITSNDVIHSWWVPEFAVKKDAIPGFINEMWVNVEKPGVYTGQCTELCGVNHGFMPVVVTVKPEKEYNEWLASKKQAKQVAAQMAESDWSLDELIEHGKGVYEKNCAACHQSNGGGIPPAFPSLVGSPIVKGSITNHIDMVYNGKKGTAMQAFGSQLDKLDIAAVVSYERNAWGNNSGDKVTPKDVEQFKKSMGAGE